MIQSIRDFKSYYLLTIEYILTFKQTLTLLLNIQVILSSDKIKLLQKQQIVNYFVKNISTRQGNRILVPIFHVLSKKIWEICTPL